MAFLSCMQSFYIQVTRGLRGHFFIRWAAHTERRFDAGGMKLGLRALERERPVFPPLLCTS